MRRAICCLLVLFLVCVFCGTKKSFAVSFDDKIYNFNSAIFKIRTTGPMNNMLEEVYIDKGGRVEATYSEMTISVFGIKKTQKQMNLRKGNLLYVYNPKTKTATERNLQEDFETMSQGTKSKDINTLGKDMVKQLGGKKVRTEKLKLQDGQTIKTEVYVFGQYGTEVWYFKGYPVKSVTKAQNMQVTREVLEMQLNVPIPKDKISLLKGTKITKAPSMKNVMGQINAYKNLPEYQQESSRQQSEIEDTENYQGQDIDSRDEMTEGVAGEEVKEALGGLLKSIFK